MAKQRVQHVGKFVSALVSVACGLKTINHVKDWSHVEDVDCENHKARRWIKEAIQVRKLGEGSTCNRDESGYELSHMWDPLLSDDDRQC